MEWVQRAVCHLQNPPDSSRSLSVHQKLITSVHVRKSAKGVVLAEGGEGDLGEFWLCKQKRLDPGSHRRKKKMPVAACTLNSLRGQRWHHAVGCGARPAVPSKGCRGSNRSFGSAWAVRVCQGTPVSGL